MRRGLFALLCLLGACAEPTAPPAPPTLGPITSPTALLEQVVTGTKPASTAITFDGEEMVPLDESTTWHALVPLARGNNRFAIEAVDSAGRRSDPIEAVIVVDVEAHPAPTLAPLPSVTLEDTVTVSGTMIPGATVLLNGVVLDTEASATTFRASLPLAVGANAVRAATRDLAGNESDVIAHVITRVEATATTHGPTGVVSIDVAGDAIAWQSEAGEIGAGDTTGDVLLAGSGGSRPAITAAGVGAHVVWLVGDKLMTPSANPGGGDELIAEAVSDMDVAATSDGSPAVAFVSGENVLFSRRQADVWQPPIVVSDGAAGTPLDVGLAISPSDVVTIVWSANDNGRADLWARQFPVAGAFAHPPLVVSETSTSTSAPAVAAVSDTGAVIGWVSDDEGLLVAVDGATFSNGAADAPHVVTDVAGHGAAQGLTLASDGAELLVAWLDDGPDLIGDQDAPAVVVVRGQVGALGAPLVVSSQPASSPAVSWHDGEARVGFVEDGRARLLRMNLPFVERP